MRIAIGLVALLLTTSARASESRDESPKFAIGVRVFRAAAGEFEVTGNADEIHAGLNSGMRLNFEAAFHERWSFGLNGGFALAGASSGGLSFGSLAVEPTLRFRLTSHLSSGPWIGVSLPFWRFGGQGFSGEEDHLHLGADLLAGFTYRLWAGLFFEGALGVGAFGRWDRVPRFEFPGVIERFATSGGLRALGSLGWSF